MQWAIMMELMSRTMKNDNNLAIKPFLKWAGGKSQLLSEIRIKYPSFNDNNINKYCEPFVGGGAVLFDIIFNKNIKMILINDINVDLINLYRVVQNNVSDLIENLLYIEKEYLPMSYEQKKKYYYKIREEFNKIKLVSTSSKNIEKAANFIFLNKTCFNGLYRVNSDGKYNVPMGDFRNPVICDNQNLTAVSKALSEVTIQCGDFFSCKSFIDSRTFVYIDPPYRPLNKTSSFKSYSEYDFSDKEQIRLGDFINEIHKNGAYVILSNSDPKNNDVNDSFFDDLYKNYNIMRVNARRMINSVSSKRGSIKELLVTNF